MFSWSCSAAVSALSILSFSLRIRGSSCISFSRAFSNAWSISFISSSLGFPPPELMSALYGGSGRPRAAAPAVLRQGVVKGSAIGIPLRRAIAFGSGTLMA
jgi:hypothetical protein